MSNIKSSPDRQALADWSKWITGISLFSASGCVGVLVTKGVGEKNIINIKLAIVFFLLSIIVAWLIQLVIAMQKTSEPGDNSGAISNSSDSPNSSNTSSTFRAVKGASRLNELKALILLEILMFSLSCFFLARWVWKFPPNPVAVPAAPVVVTDSSNIVFTNLQKETLQPSLLNRSKIQT
jgi:uncharacterized membrane protein YqaE (UPF0057 family)